MLHFDVVFVRELFGEQFWFDVVVEEHARESQVLDALALVREVTQVVGETGFILACLARQRSRLMVLIRFSGRWQACSGLLLSFRIAPTSLPANREQQFFEENEQAVYRQRSEDQGYEQGHDVEELHLSVL